MINWLPFWSQFEKIHSDPDLHDSDKFAYLVQHMKVGSRAKVFIESYPVTFKNYEKAVSALRERFGKPELLIEVYVRELIKLIISNVKAENRDKLPLEKLYDKIEAQLNLTTQDSLCIFCEESHKSKNCYSARSLSFDDKLAKVKEKRCCLKCLEPQHI